MNVDLNRFRHAVAKHLGQPLTPEVAAAIEGECRPINQARDQQAFEIFIHGDSYTFGAERFADIVDELDAMHRAQWAETEVHRHAIEFCPDYDGLREHERAGSLIQFTVRSGAELVGHMRLYVHRSLHTQSLFAQEDTLYITPEHRAGMVGLAFLRYIERQLREVGVREIRFDVKHVNNASALLRRLKYESVSTRYVKILGGGNVQ